MLSPAASSGQALLREYGLSERSWFDARRIGLLSPVAQASFQAFLSAAQKLPGIGAMPVKVPASKILEGLASDLRLIPTSRLVSGCFDQKRRVLDLSRLPEVIANYRRELVLSQGQSKLSGTLAPRSTSQLFDFIDFLARQTVFLNKVASNPASTVAHVFSSLESAVYSLGFLNVVISAPQNDGSWKTARVTRDWKSVQDPKLERGVTLKSIVQAPGTVFHVDLADPQTFIEAGIEMNPRAVENDLKNSKGPTDVLFFKIVSARGPEAVVQIHNRVKNAEQITLDHLLPEDQDEATRMKSLLAHYFHLVGEAISVIRRRQEYQFEIVRELSVDRRVGTEEPLDKIALMANGRPLQLAGEHEGVFIEHPIRFCRKSLQQVLDWFREEVWRVYKDTKIGHEFVNSSPSLDVAKMRLWDSLGILDNAGAEEHLLAGTYLGLVLNREKTDIAGIATGELYILKDTNEFVLYIPGAMIEPEARGAKAHVAMVDQMCRSTGFEIMKWMGERDGRRHLSRKGLALTAWTQSKQVILDLMPLTDFHVSGVPIPASSRNQRNMDTVLEKQRVKVDEQGIHRNRYHGEISDRNKENSIRFERPGFLWALWYQLTGTRQIRRELDYLFDQVLGPYDAVFVIGYYDNRVRNLTWLNLKMQRVRRFFVKRRKPIHPNAVV